MSSTAMSFEEVDSSMEHGFEVVSPVTTQPMVTEQSKPVEATTEEPKTKSDQLTFSGKQDESVADFLEAIQKHAFEQDRGTDERWMSSFVASCLKGDAMLWYALLDDRNRNHWTKLRKALVTKYGPPQPTPSPTPFLNRPFGATPIPRGIHQNLPTLQTPPSFVRPKAENELRGRIEVFVPERNLWLGYLSSVLYYHANGNQYQVTGDKKTSATVGFIADPNGKLIQMEMVGSENAVPDTCHPYIGLALEEPTQNVQPTPYIPSAMTHYTPGLQPLFYGAPPSSMVGQPVQLSSTPTWSLKPCTESRKDGRYNGASKTQNLWERASATVWKYDSETKELSLAWVNADGAEEKLEVSVPKFSPGMTYGNANLIAHRANEPPSGSYAVGTQVPGQTLSVQLIFAEED